MRAYIIYNKRTCVTGKAIFDYLKENRVGGYSWRRTCKTPPKTSADLLLRWGNSIVDSNIPIVLNSRNSVRNATDKLTTIRILSETDGVSIPPVLFNNSFSGNNESARFYRNSSDQIRYRRNPVYGDKYSLSPIDKVMELRVHIFDGKTIGVYEKMPYENGTVIYKDHNCRFRRINASDETQRQSIVGARPMARAAVNALGLLFGGVDMIKDSEGNWYCLEVNSAPALNTENILRWGQTFHNHIVNSRN